MKVNFYATFREIVGKKSVEFEYQPGMTVGDLVNQIVQAYPAMRRELLDQNGRLYGHVHVLVNGRDAPYLEQALDTPLDPDDTVNVFPSVGGGAPRL